ncbi:DUF6113 family protein [Streptomyces sp. BI20]|uniref:DUF6113 family protein n=1 Tax=Streptomyces sp. BI20 TaxID=3403460 RepID=UPI003C7181A8
MSATWTPARLLALLGALLAGVLTGLAGWLAVDVWRPVGLLLALLALLGVCLGSRLAVGGPLGVGAVGVGWFLVYVMLSVPRPEGDFLLSASGMGMYVYLLGGVIIAVICATLRDVVDRPVSAARPGR